MATTLYQALSPQAVYAPHEPVNPDYSRFVEDGQVSRGLKSALVGASADSAASDYWQARAAGDLPRAKANLQRAQQLTQEAAQVAPRVQSLRDTHGVGDFVDWGAGVMGSLPVSAVPAMGGGLAGGVLGGLVAGPGGAIIGSQLGSAGGMYPQLRDAARLQQLQSEQKGAQQLAPQHVLDDTSRQAGWQAGIEGLVPGLAAGSLVRGTAANVLRQPVASAAKRIGRDVALDTGAAGVSEGVAMGYETGRDPSRDTTDDGWRLADAMAGEAAGGVAYGALGHAGDVGHQLLGGGAAAVGDAAAYTARAGKRGALAAGAAAKQAWDARPQSWDEAAVMVGEGAANLHNKAEDMVTRWTQRGQDADVDVLLTPQKGMDEAGLRADDAAKHQAAANFIAKTQANPGAVPDYVHAAVQQYMQGSKTMDSWRPVADAVNDMHRSENILSGANDLLSEKLAPVAEKLGKGAADLMNAKDDALTAYHGKRAADGRQNAMTPAMGRKIANERDDFSPILEESLAPFTGLKTPEALENALPTLGHAMRNWVANGFSMTKGGETVVPKSLLTMFTDPAAAVVATTQMMHKQGLIDDGARQTRARVLEQIKVLQDTKKHVGTIVEDNLLPTAARGLSAVDHDLIAEDLMDQLERGKIDSAEARRLFGPRARMVLDALKAKTAIGSADIEVGDGRERSVSGLSDEYGSTADNAGQNIIPGMGSEDMAQITSSHLDEDVGAPTVKYHHYRDGSTDKTTGEIKLDEPFKVRGRVKNRPDKLGNAVPDTFHDTVAKQRIAEMHGVGAREVKPQGYMDYLREKYGNDADGLMSAATKIIESKKDDLLRLQNKTGREVTMADGSKQVQHDDLGKVLNDNYYVLREEAQREKGEATNVTADEFGREGANGQIIGNKWAEKVGKDGEYGTTTHGRIWLERMGSDGKPREFATSASRVIDRMLKARKTEGRVDESSGLAGQRTALHQGLASLLTAEGADGTSVLSGRIGFKETANGPIQWQRFSESTATKGPKAGQTFAREFDFPDSLRMFSKEATYKDAKEAAKEAANQKILAAGKALLKSLSTRLANMEPTAKGRSYVIEDIEDLQAALEARDARSVDVSLRKSEKYELGREDDDVNVNEIGADTYETKPVIATKIIARDARDNLFGSKKAALEGLKALREPGYDYRVVRSSESVVNKSGEESSRTARAASRSHHKWVIVRTLTGQVRNSAETKSGKPNTRSVQVWREISSHSSQADAQSAYDAHVRQLADEQGDDGSGWPDLRVSKMEGSGPSKTSRGTPERWAFQEAHYLRSGSIPFGSEIGEMGKVTEFRSRHEDGESDGERNYDELGQALHPFDSRATPAADKEARAQRTAFVTDALAKGVPSFVAMARKLSPERREALAGHLQGMLDGKWPDGRLDGTESARARVALIELGKMQGVTKKPAKPSAPPSQKFADVADKMSDYLKNPPADYNVKQVEAIRDWATKQEARLKAEAAKHEEGSDEYDRLDDLRFKATLLRAEALKALKTEAEVAAHQDETGGPRYNAQSAQGRLTSLAEKILADPSVFPKTADFGAFLDALSTQGLPRTKQTLMQSSLYKESLRELNAAIKQGAKNAAETKGAMLDALGRLTMFTDATATVNRLHAALKVKGETLKGLMLATEKGTEHSLAGARVVAKAVRDTVGNIPAKIVVLPSGVLGEFRPDLGEIHISPDVGPSIVWISIHEGVHAATLRALHDNPTLHRQLYTLMDHVAAQDKTLVRAYGMTNVMEFLAEGLSNSSLQAKLKTIPPNAGVAKYLGRTAADAWVQFVDLMRKALGIPVSSGSALTQLLDLAGMAVKETAAQPDVPFTLDAVTARGIIPAKDIEAAVDKLAKLTSNKVVEGLKQDPSIKGKSLVPHAVGLALETIASSAQLIDALKRAKSYGDVEQLVHAVLGILSNHTAAARFNKQDPHAAFGTNTSAPATPAEVEKFHADIARRLGPGMKSAALEMLYGKDAKGKEIMLSGKWEKGAIYASVYARNLGQVGAHESFHEFFDRMEDVPEAAEVMKLLARAANAPYVVRQLERLLDGETEALKQIKQGAPNAVEERMAYMFQFHQAGLLTVGPETENIFTKIAAFFRKVAGMLNDDERADMLLRQFDAGKMQTADAAARVLANSVTARQKMYEGVNGAFRPMMDRASRLINTAETNLERTGNPVYKEIRRMFKRSVGEDGAQGFLDAKDHQMKMWGNRLATVFEGLHPKDLELAAPYLHTGETPKDPAVKQLVARLKGPAGLLPQIHKYLTEAGVKRWEASADGEGGEWVPMGKIDHGYFPRAYDTAMILGNVDGFVADLVKHNPDELGAIAAAQNATLAKSVGKDFTPVTADDVAKAIANRLINAFGQTEIEESGNSIGFSPFMQSVNRRQLHWIHPEMLKKYGDKDVSRILTGYIAQGVKRAEYVRKFGNGGEVLQAKLEEAYEAQLKQLTSKGMSPDDAKVKALKTAGAAAKDVMAMEGTLGYNISPKNRQVQNSVMVYQNMRLLSMSLFSQFIDPLNLLVRGATVSDAWNAYKRGLREVVASIKDDPIKDLDAKIADQVGTTDANHFLAAFGQLHGSQYLGTKFRKINDVMFKYNGMEGFNRGMQVAATRAAINFIKRHVQQPNERSTAYLKELNLTAKDVTVDADGELDYTDPRIQQALHQWVNGSVLRPNAAQRPAWASDPHYMVFWHMKQFAYTFHDVVLKRALHDYKKFGDMGPAGMLALTYTPVMIASDALKSVLLTGDEPVWMKGGLDSELEHGAMRAGLLGKFQPMADTLAPHHTVLSLGGPAVEQITEMFTDAPAETAVNALPGANVWNTMKGNSLADGHPDN